MYKNYHNIVDMRYTWRDLDLIAELPIFSKHIKLLTMIFNGKGAGFAHCKSLGEQVATLSTNQQFIYAHALHRKYHDLLARK